MQMIVVKVTVETWRWKSIIVWNYVMIGEWIEKMGKKRWMD